MLANLPPVIINLQLYSLDICIKDTCTLDRYIQRKNLNSIEVGQYTKPIQINNAFLVLKIKKAPTMFGAFFLYFKTAT